RSSLPFRRRSQAREAGRRAGALAFGSESRVAGCDWSRRLIHMPIRIVRLGTARQHNEGVRIGTVRRPPRGVPKHLHAAQNWYDVWLPDLAPSAELVKIALTAGTAAEWAAFVKGYRREMAAPAAQ